MNIAELQALDNIELKQKDLDEIGTKVIDGFKIDKQSRAEWETRNANAMKLALQVMEDKTFPWEGASNIKFPMVTISAIGFSARAYPGLISSTEPVKCRVNGFDETGEKAKRAARVSKHMSYQILEEDEDWEPETDNLLITVPIVGTSFKKTYYDPLNKKNRSIHVSAENLVVGYFTKGLESTRRISHIIPLYANEIKEREMAGLFNKIEYSTPIARHDDITDARDEQQGVMESENDLDAPHIFIEQHRWLDLDGDGYEEPYIVTVHLDTSKVVRIVNRFDKVQRDADDNLLRITAKQHFTKFGFIPSPDGGFYDLGFGCLLGPLNESTNTLINQLVDAGTMSNLGGGFLGRGVRLKGGKQRFEPGEWKRVDSYGDDLRKGLVPLPIREPSNVLFSLLGLLIDYGQRLGSSTDMMTGVNPGQNQAATTTQAVVEQGMKVFNGIFKRLHRSLKCEFRKLYALNRIHLDPTAYFDMIDSGEQSEIFQADYYGDPNDITPSSDPNIASEAQKLAKADAVSQSAMANPGAYNMYEVEKRKLEALGVEGIELILPDPQGPNAIPPMPNPQIEMDQMKIQIEQAKEASKSQMEQSRIELENMKHQLNEVIAQTKSQDEQEKIEISKEQVRIDWYNAETQRINATAETGKTEDKTEK